MSEPRQFPRRAEKARRTRMALVTAAGELFAERGYSATTVADIAERADVARATVFTAVPGGKPELLKLARDLALAGDDEDVPVPQRPWMREAMEQTDPRRLVALQARNYRRILDRAARLEHALAVAAETDETVATLYAESRRQRHFGTTMVVRRLAELGALRRGLTRDAAADLIYALASPDTYRLLVLDRGWSADRYQRWLTEELGRLLR